MNKDWEMEINRMLCGYIKHGFCKSHILSGNTIASRKQNVGKESRQKDLRF